MRRISPGQTPRYTASDWNTLAELADRMRRALDSSAFERKWDYPVVKVRNESGTDRNRGEILAITDEPYLDFPDASDDIGDPLFRGITPTTPTYCGRFVVLLEPVKSVVLGGPGIARAMLHGLVKARVNITSTAHRYADVTNNDCTKLTSREIGGAQIVAAKSGTGTKWAWVRLGHPVPRPRLATLTETLANGQEKNATLDDGRTVKLKCRLIPTGTLAIGTICEVLPQPDSDAWIVIAVHKCKAS